MPRAEAGTTKAIANQMKSKGLQRLRWYCQACQRQMRDENGFKCHVASESHVRNMMTIGEDPRKAINDFSRQFQRDFIQLLRTGHGEKNINANHFYQEYISNKEHVHMTATRWNSLTEFCKELGRQGIVRVNIDEKNEERGGASALMISWVDNSPENLRRQEALKKKERQDRGDEHREQKMIEEQIRRAREVQEYTGGEDVEEVHEEEDAAPALGIRRPDGEKIKLSFGAKKTEPEKPPSPPLTEKSASPEQDNTADTATILEEVQTQESRTEDAPQPDSKEETPARVLIKPMSLASSKPKNVFAAAGKKNALTGPKKPLAFQQQKPISEAERIMKEELERKRQREERGSNPMKKQRVT